MCTLETRSEHSQKGKCGAARVPNAQVHSGTSRRSRWQRSGISISDTRLDV